MLDQPLALPEIPTYLHDVIGSQDLVGGIAPKVGSKFIRVVAIDGFLG